MPLPGDADADAVFVRDLLRGRLRRRLVEIDRDDVRAFLHEPVRGFLADAAARADDDVDLPGQFLFRRHALELGFFEQPVFDVERLLLRERDVFVDRLRAAHDFHRAVVELGGHARLRLVLAPRDHAEAGDEDDRRVRVAHRGRVRRACTVRNTRRSPGGMRRGRSPRSFLSAVDVAASAGFHST